MGCCETRPFDAKTATPGLEKDRLDFLMDAEATEQVDTRTGLSFS